MEKYGVQYGLLHTTNLYPTKPAFVRLGAMEAMMKEFRNNPLNEIDNSKVVLIKDFVTLKAHDLSIDETYTLKMPTTSNVLQYFTEDKTKISIRPSGTEPKIKFYIEVHGKLASRAEYDAANIAGVLAALSPERKKEVEEELTKHIRPLPDKDIHKISADTVGRFKTDAMLYCDEGWTPQGITTVDARGMSDGTLRFIAIVAALLTGRERSLLIIEEIDNGLHPSRVNKLIEVLRALGQARQIDILCTTHNPALIDALGNAMIPLISYVKRNLETGVSEIERLEDKTNLAKLMAGGTVGDLMIQGKI